MPWSPQAWAEAVVDSRQGGDAPPDGEHDVTLINAKIATRARDDYQWIVLTWRVAAGVHRDTEWESMHSLEQYKPDGERNPGLAYTAEALRKIGVDVDRTPFNDVEAIAQACRPFYGHPYTVNVKTNGQFTNTYVTHALTPPTGYGQPPAQTIADAATERRDIERTGASDVPSDVPWSPEYQEQPAATTTTTVDREAAPKKGDVDPETGEEIPF